MFPLNTSWRVAKSLTKWSALLSCLPKLAINHPMLELAKINTTEDRETVRMTEQGVRKEYPAKKERRIQEEDLSWSCLRDVL